MSDPSEGFSPSDQPDRHHGDDTSEPFIQSTEHYGKAEVAVFEFLELLRADRDQSKVRELAEYMTLFPHAQEAVAREYLNLTGAARPGDFGPYEILSEIGRGGQAVVKLARDTRLERRVAIKMLNGHYAPAHLDRFRREAAVASRLRHPSICVVFETGIIEDVPFIAMQHIEGETLATRIKTKQLPPRDDLLEFFEKAARALHFAHEQGVVHRDVKPNNIMFTPDGEPMLFDFGLAGDETAEAALTFTGDRLGTPPFMSPEQVKGDRGAIDRRTDVYSLGVALFQALAGRLPFEHPTRAALFDAILSDEAPRLRSITRDWGTDLEVVVATAIAKVPRDRYRSAAHFADELARVRKHEPIEARAAGPLLRLRRWCRRRPAVAASLAFAFLSLATGLVVSLTQTKRAIEERSRADRRAAEYERLADARKLDELRIRAERELWPAVPATIPAMDNWLIDACEIASRLEIHRASLRQLRRRAVPSPTRRESVESDETYYRLRELTENRRRLERIDERIQELDDDDLSELEDHIADRIDAVDIELEHNRPALIEWEFEDPKDDWRHEKLSQLVRELEAFVGDDVTMPTVRSVEVRREAAATLAERSIGRFRAEWDVMIQAIEESDLYGGLRIVPQVGLHPLRINDFGYAEFAHVASGTAPRWNATTGRYESNAETGIVLVLLPGGTFRMGSPPNERDRTDRERLHLVTLGPFFIGRHEVTQSQWRRILGSNPSTLELGPRHPVETISWHDASRFCRRSDLELPTEAQWEFACRAGTTTRFAWGDDSDVLRSRTNIGDQSLAGRVPANYPLASWSDDRLDHAPVDFGAPNGYGLFGFHGNVSEWCADAFGADYPPNSLIAGDGYVGGSTEYRVYRDGNYFVFPGLCRSATRLRQSADARNKVLGLRVSQNLAKHDG